MSITEGFRKPPSQAYEAAIVRFYQGTTVAGTGFCVSNHYILTCAHVVSQCIGLGKRCEEILAANVKGNNLEVDFPVDRSGQKQPVEIVLELWRVNDEDVAVLKLTSPLPSGVATVTLKDAFSSDSPYWKHPFAVYGFPDKRSDGTWVTGELLGGQPGLGRTQTEGTKAEGLSIRPGFSGSPVWDETLGGVVGMTVARDKEEVAKIGFMIPYQQLKPVLEAIALFDLLLPEISNLDSHWQAAYRLVRPQNSTEASAKTLPEAIVQVQDMSSSDSAYRAIEQFIGYLARPKLGLDIQPRLIQWLASQNIDASALIDAVQQKIDQQRTNQPIVLAPHLLFWVQAELNSDRYSVQAYLVSDREHYDPLSATQLTAPAAFLEQSQDEKVDCEIVEKILRQCLEESVEKLPKEGGLPPITVNVFLPLSCVGWEVDRWSINEYTKYTPDLEPIGSQYHIVLRTAERLNKQICRPQMQAKWSEKWSLFNQNQDKFAHERLICGRDETPITLSKKLSRKTDSLEMLGFYLVEAPKPSTDENPGLFPVLIGSGAPLAIWLRQDLSDRCQQDFTQLLTCCFSELASNVQGLRQRAHQECDDGDNHVGQHIGFIWEDPKLVPPIAPRFRMSA